MILKVRTIYIIKLITDDEDSPKYQEFQEENAFLLQKEKSLKNQNSIGKNLNEKFAVLQTKFSTKLTVTTKKG